MTDTLETLAACAREVAERADVAREQPSEIGLLLTAMMNYRSAAVHFLAHPSAGDQVHLGGLIKAQALKYSGETREALERIAKLVDSLNKG